MEYEIDGWHEIVADLVFPSGLADLSFTTIMGHSIAQIKPFFLHMAYDESCKLATVYFFRYYFYSTRPLPDNLPLFSTGIQDRRSLSVLARGTVLFRNLD